MDGVVILTPSEAVSLLAELNSTMERRGLHSLRVWTDGTNAKFKVNEHTWSPPLGRADEAR